MDHKVLVCQNTTCTKQGAAKVLKAFEDSVPDGTEVESSGCLGQCGSGPTVLIVPEKQWCLHVQPYLVPSLVKQHLEDEMAEAERQPTGSDSNGPNSRIIWLAVIGFSGGVIAVLTWIFAQQSAYF